MKKKLLLLLITTFTLFAVQAQVINMTNGSSSACSGNFYDSGGSGGNYANNQTFVYTICPSVAGNYVSINFSAFNLENNWDFLYVYNGNSIAAPLIGTYTGGTSPGIITASLPGGCLTFRFTSDGSTVASGWAATISCVTTPPPAPIIMTNGSTTACSGTFLDSGGTGNYANNQNLTYTICPDVAGNYVSVNFSAFNLENGWDFLYVYNGSTIGAPLIGTYTGTTLPGTITASLPGGCLTFVFTSDGSSVASGWVATVNCVTTPPPAPIIMTNGSTTACSGTFLDNGGTGNYTNSQNLTYTICPSTPGSYVFADFTAFNTESGWDFLTIYNGSSTAAPVIGTYTGTNSPGNIGSTIAGGCLTFVFTSDGSGVAAGWLATISCSPTPWVAPPPAPCMANAFCSSTAYNFPNATTGTAPVGPNYGCMGTQPNPVWYYMEIGTAGTLQLTIGQTTGTGGSGIGLDVDFAMWGPFPSLATGCASVMSGTPTIQSSYSISATETLGIGLPGGSNSICFSGTGATTPPAATVGQVYIVLISNFDGDPGYITFGQTGGTGSADCSIVLPIELSMFTGENVNDVNKLEWVTNAEMNNDYFQVERSSDGSTWNSIGTIDGMGTTQETQRYSLNDVTYANTMNYYRLKQVDFNGTISYSNRISIDNLNEPREIVRVVNLVGQEIDLNTDGLIIIVYSDGTTEKRMN